MNTEYATLPYSPTQTRDTHKLKKYSNHQYFFTAKVQLSNGVPTHLSCLTCSPPGHVPPIILPLQLKARSASSEVRWIYGTV